MTQCGLVSTTRDPGPSIADEAARLLEALGLSAPEGFAHHEVDDSLDEVCRWCPVCRVVRFARDAGPDTIEALAHLASAIGLSLADLAAARRDETPSPPSGAPSGVDVTDIPVTDDELDESGANL